MGNCNCTRKKRCHESCALDESHIEMRIMHETKLQSSRKYSVDDNNTKVVVTSTVRELDQMRRELHNIKRDLNLEIMQFTTSFNQLLSAVHSLANLDKKPTRLPKTLNSGKSDCCIDISK